MPRRLKDRHTETPAAAVGEQVKALAHIVLQSGPRKRLSKKKKKQKKVFVDEKWNAIEAAWL